MENYKAKINDWSEIILNWDTIVIDFDFPIMLSKEQVEMILKLKMNLQNLWDDHAVELTNNAWVVVVQVKDILLLGK